MKDNFLLYDINYPNYSNSFSLFFLGIKMIRLCYHVNPLIKRNSSIIAVDSCAGTSRYA